MRDDFGALWAASPSTQRRAPTPTELAGGYPCGPFDIQLFNELAYALSSVLAECNGVLDAAGIVPNAASTTQLAAAIAALGASPALASIPGRTQIFLTSGTFIVPAGITQVEVELIGGGGGAGASADGTSGSLAGNIGGGGSGGGYAYKRISGLVPGAAIPATVGAAGQGANNANGTAGGTSSFGPYASATGGGRGYSGTNTTMASDAAGMGIGGDLNISGQLAGRSGPNSGTPTASDLLRNYGRGGMPPRGFGTVHIDGTGYAGNGFGAGGTSASGGSGLPGGNGAPGLIIARW